MLRDEATRFDAQFGQAVAKLRHEVWQYTNQYGGWVKEKRTRVFDRVLTGKADLQRWTWLWDPRLGGIEIDSGTRVVEYELPEKLTGDMPRGLLAAAP